jgi:glycosyltransferase involved in cell wall biosynthesis
MMRPVVPRAVKTKASGTADSSISPIAVLNVVRFPVGGIRSYLGYTYSRLDPDAYTTTIVAVADRETALLADGMAPMRVEIKAVAKTQPLLRLWLETARMLRTGAFQIVHSQGTSAAVATALSARWFQIPHVVTLHETLRAEQFAGVTGNLKRKLIARLLGLADSIVVISEDARQNVLTELPFTKAAAQRVQLMRNGVAVERLRRSAHESPAHLRRQCGLDDHVVLLGFLGRFMPEKGFDLVLDAVQMLMTDGRSRPPFVVVAVNEGAYLREYQRDISARGLDKHFVFLGLQPSAASVMSELDAVLMPSRREACGLVAMEAMVLGCPVIAANCVGLREVIADGPALKMIPGDAASLAASIDRFLADRASLRDQARAYAPTARAMFDSARTAEQLSALFDRVSAARRPRPHVRPFHNPRGQVAGAVNATTNLTPTERTDGD